MKLKKAAQNTAYCGRRTRVETIVAMEFAASCRPFRKSKASATAISPMRIEVESHARVRSLKVFDHDAAHAVRDVLEAIDTFSRWP